MHRTILPIFMALLLATAFIAPQAVSAREAGQASVDKALCKKMTRFGKQAYDRGKYLTAKEFFRKAVQADPDSVLAWRYYDLSVVFALAGKVEQNMGKRTDMLAPGVSVRKGAPPGTPKGHIGVPPPSESGGRIDSPPPSEPKGHSGPPPNTGFKIEEDEGC
ncbi:MAG: hypothetical protein JRJ86_00310 [Deltaproteobacteria bacterium]|nr:hypothetical protein [Deltaproteobacteria bacterium]MBW2117134.1 hypothetical protein [Deltaproteobacteria bacterium]MBW2342749.1 hypothetical protein [Deltaproteobacteria bacterium]